MNNLSEGYKMVATLGNQGIFAKDQAIRTKVAGKAVLQVPKGQFVAVNVDTGKSIDDSQVASTPLIKMGVSSGKDIRWLPGVYGIGAKNMEGLAVSPPKAAVNEIVDNWYKCANCDDRYGLAIEVIDEDTIDVMGDVDNGILYNVDETIDCTGCEPNCNPEANCSSVNELLIPALNAKAEKAIERKFWVTPIYDNDSYWCFTVDANGDLATPITTFTIAGVTTTLSSPATNQDDLERVKAEIEEYIATNNINGTVTVIGTHRMGITGKPYILVNTDETDFDLAGHTACKTATPRAGHTSDECAFRVIGTLPQMDCECEIQRVLRYKPRHIFVRAFSGFQDLESTYIQTSEVAQNFGAELQILEYQQEVGGEGRGSHHSNTFNDTNFAISADPVSRLKTYAGNVDCNKDYVKFHLNYTIPHRGSKGFGNTVDGISPNAYIAVPAENTDTIVAIQTFLNAMGAVAGIPPINYTGTVLEQVRGENL